MPRTTATAWVRARYAAPEARPGRHAMGATPTLRPQRPENAERRSNHASWPQCGAIAQIQSAGMRAAAMASASGASAWADA